MNGTILDRQPDHFDPATQPAVAADRCAREIVGILEDVSAARSRQLNGNPLGGHQTNSSFVLQRCCMMLWLTNAVLLRWNESSVGCRLVVLVVVPVSAVSSRIHTKARCAACDTGRRGSAERSCSYRGSAAATCLTSAF
jgi:hypothetical protein